MSIDHAFVAVGRPNNPGGIVVLDAWQNNSAPRMARDFNFPFLVDGQVTSEASMFRPDGRDYLQMGRQSVDIASMTQTRDTTAPAIDPQQYAGQSHMWHHTMPDPEPSSQSRPEPRHHQRRPSASMLER
ncbi:hypothetical protein ACFUIW_30330 [Streptomyces sp. NPDC057245]|uniref:hypothetical protein n=1 Tax=Streptomyces sp. NPDC057245 TaxID=3346065 RepID=UPI0036333C1D